MQIISTVVGGEDRFLITVGKEELAAMALALLEPPEGIMTVDLGDQLADTLDAAFGEANW